MAFGSRISTFGTSAATALPAVVNAPGLDHSRPAFTSEGRYLAFVRRGADGRDRLLVFDTQTQTILNSASVDLGALDPQQGAGLLRRIDGNVSLEQRLVFISAQLAGSSVKVNLAKPATVGILVQRIVGRKRLLGRRVLKLRRVGRVPLGRFRRGKARIKWNRRVRGRRLKPGRYLVTPRAVTRKKARVREYGKPRRIRIRRRRR